MSAADLAAASPPEDGIVGWVIGLMETLGAPGAGLAIALENLFPPIPSEAILPLAGFTASRGELGLVEAIVWTTAGSLVGALALYGLGALLGRDRFRALAARVPLVKVSDLDRTEAWFAKYGPAAVLLGRMIPIFRSLISVPAGIERMALPMFVGLTALGSLIWNTAFIVAGYLLGESWHLVEGYVGIVGRVVLVATAAAGLGFVAVRAHAALHARRGAQGHPLSDVDGAAPGEAEKYGGAVTGEWVERGGAASGADRPDGVDEAEARDGMIGVHRRRPRSQ